MNRTVRIAHRLAERVTPTPRENPGGTLRVFGQWFGRPWDNRHLLTGMRADDDVLILSFDEGEVLRVWAPTELTFEGKWGFTLHGADSAHWRWYYYGRPRLPENLREFRYALEPGGVRVSGSDYDGTGVDRTADTSDRTISLLEPGG